MSDQMLQNIIMNLGDKTPYLLLVLMFMKYMWPDVKSLLEQYLLARTASQSQPDPLAQSVSGLSARFDALMNSVTSMASTLGGYVEENRRAQGEMSRMVQVVVGLVGDVARDRLRASVSTQSPVSPTAPGPESTDTVAAAVQ